MLDLATRSGDAAGRDPHVDDQAEWLDDEQVLYRVGEEIWEVPADGTGHARRYLAA